MCLAIPGRVIDIAREHDVLMGRVDFGGVARQVCLEHVPDTAVGDYVLVHVGFALARIDEAEARRVLALLSPEELDGELGSPPAIEELVNPPDPEEPAA
jgi:hydrogenase expression/formation protein HypC